MRSAWHYYKPKDDPLVQARHFIKQVGDLQPADLPLVLDIEEAGSKKITDTGSWQLQVLSLLDYLEQHTVQRPTVYTTRYFADTFLKKKEFERFPLWLAEYTDRTEPVLPFTWKETGHTFWQKEIVLPLLLILRILIFLMETAKLFSILYPAKNKCSFFLKTL